MLNATFIIFFSIDKGVRDGEGVGYVKQKDTAKRVTILWWV